MQAQFVFALLQGENQHQVGGLLTERVEVRKQVGFLFTKWKTRWLTLTPDGLYLRRAEFPQFNKEPFESLNSPGTPSYTDAIALTTGGARVELAGYDRKHRVYLFDVHVDLWLKRLKLVWKPRVFTIGVFTEDAAKRWVRERERERERERA